MAGARPTITAVTDDASRGGLFVQSNVANPVSGADVQGTVINDSTITLSVSIDGNVQTGTFTTNQASDGTVSLVFTGIGDGGSTSPTTGGDPVIDGNIVGNNIVLDLMSGNTVDINISTLATDTELQDAIAALVIPTNITNLMDVPNSLGTMGQILAVNAAGDALEWIDQPEANVSVNSFRSLDNTVTFEEGTGVNAGRVLMEAQPQWINSTNRAPTGTTSIGDSAQVNALNITIGDDTGLVLVNNLATGHYILRAAGAAPTPAGNPGITSPIPSSVLTSSPPEVVTLTPSDGTFTSVTNPVITPPAGVPAPTPTIMVSTGGTSATVTIPAGGANAPGTYGVRVTTVTQPTDMDAMPRTDMPSATVTRFIPFVQSRSDFMTAADITGTTGPGLSTAAYDGAIGLTSIGGSGILYIGVLARDIASSVRRAVDQDNTFRYNVGFLRNISVTLADGNAVSYNVFRIAGVNAGRRIAQFT